MYAKVVYFSLTGNSERVAQRIAQGLGVKCLRLTDDVNWKGWRAYVKCVFWRNERHKIHFALSGNLGGYDTLIVVAPVWAGGLPPTVMRFLKGVDKAKVSLVTTCAGDGMKKGAGDYQAFTQIQAGKGDEDKLIAHVVEQTR